MRIRRGQRRRKRCRTNMLLLVLGMLMFFVVMHSFYQKDASTSSSTPNIFLPRNHIATQPDRMLVYDLRPNATSPTFLQQVNVESSFVPRTQFMDIDLVHRTGQFHSGTSQFVVDAKSRILFVKRGPQLKTCPNSWMMIGEHSWQDETPLETAKRGMLEELGANIVPHVRFYKALTTHPLFYYQEMADRTDRQFLYTWWVQLNSSTQQDLKLEFDQEVAEYKWVSMDELDTWIQDEYHIIKSGGQTNMCHEAIVRLIEVCAKRLRAMMHATAALKTGNKS